MRSTSIALSSLAVLLAWDLHSPVQAASESELSAIVTDAEAKISTSQVADSVVRVAPPEAIVVPEVRSDRISPTDSPDSLPNYSTSTVQISSSNTPISVSKPQTSVSDTPISTSDTPISVPDTPISVSDTPISVSDTPISVPDTPISVSDTPISVPDTPISVPDTPISVPDTPISTSDTEISTSDTHLPVLKGQRSGSKRQTFLVASIDSPSKSGTPVMRIAQTPINPDPTASPIDRAPENTELTPLDPEDTKSELGEIEILDRPLEQTAQRRQPDVQLLIRSSVFSSSNITALDALRISDTVFVNSAQILATPKLGDTTRLIASAGGGFARFATEGDSNYNFLNFNVAIQQRIATGTYGQLGWVQDTLYRNENGERLVRDNAIQFILGRQDQLGRNLRLDSFYELRAGFADPDDQSRVVNTLGTRLRYDITPQVQGALDYRLTFKNYTNVDRADTEHQIGAFVIYNLSPDVFLAGSVSYLFGRSSDAAIDVNNLSFGLSLGFNLPLF